MNTASRLLVATLLATLSLSAIPVMAAAPARKAAVQSEEIPLLMPPIVIIGKRMTADEKMAFTQQLQQQQRPHAMKKVARRKAEQASLSALSAL